MFGVASMVHSGLNFAYFFQVRDGNAQCHHPVQAIKPFMHLTFTFTQLYFIFLHSKVEWETLLIMIQEKLDIEIKNHKAFWVNNSANTF